MFRPERLFLPRSVQVLGADTSLGRQVQANLAAADFNGTILAPDDLSPPDLAVIAADDPAAVLPGLASRGCFAAVVVSFEAHGLAEAARASQVRVLGPRSFGIASPAIGLNATRGHLPIPSGRVALVSQSASLCRAVLDWAEPNGVGFSHIVGIGGNVDLGFARTLDFLSRDRETGAILLDIRRIKDRRAFLSAARAASRLRPVVAIRPGGRLADPTGALDATLQAALRRAGILHVTGLEAFLAAAETLTRARPARGETLAIVTNALGPGQMAADAALRYGVALATLAPETREALSQLLPGTTLYTHDLVHVGRETPIRLAEAASMIGSLAGIGGVLVVHSPDGSDDAAGMAALAASAATVKQPLLVCALGETSGAAHRRFLADAGLPTFGTPEQAVRGFLNLVQNRRNRAAAAELPASVVLDLAPDIAAVRRIFQQVRSAGRLTSLQDEALAVLAAYGIPVVAGSCARTGGDAAIAAALLGFPVVMKWRQSEAARGNSRTRPFFDLSDVDAVRRAARAMAERAPDLADSGREFLVQRQVSHAHALLIQVATDPMLGPAIAFGEDGPPDQPMQRLAFDLPPLNLALAHTLIAQCPIAGTLGVFHDQPAADVGAIAETLVKVSQLIVDFPEIAELRVNPLFADSQGVEAATAWIRLHPADEIPDAVHRLAIPPYPAELTGTFEVHGENLLIRPIRPEDAEAHAAFFSRQTPEDVRFRFFSALRELSPERIARLTQIDYTREMAFVAVRPNDHATVAVARLVTDSGESSGEFAVAVQPDMKGTGLGSHLMQRLIDWARDTGMGEIVGQVLADNAPMLAFVRHLGFSLRHLPDEPDVVEARLSLNVPGL
jgi:acetyltransferase